MKTMVLLKELKKDNYECKLYQLDDYKIDVDYCDGKLDYVQIRKDHTKRYLPEIYFESGRFGGERGFKIQTTSYGSMTPVEIQEVIQGLEIAIETVEFLTREFLNDKI